MSGPSRDFLAIVASGSQQLVSGVLWAIRKIAPRVFTDMFDSVLHRVGVSSGHFAVTSLASVFFRLGGVLGWRSPAHVHAYMFVGVVLWFFRGVEYGMWGVDRVGSQVGGVEGSLGLARLSITGTLKVGLDACSRERHRKGGRTRFLVRLSGVFGISMGRLLCGRGRVFRGRVGGRNLDSRRGLVVGVFHETSSGGGRGLLGAVYRVYSSVWVVGGSPAGWAPCVVWFQGP